jgi:type 2 lantibiotic biosynthesis protein LanM
LAAETRIEALLARWCDRAARGDPLAFGRRLAWDGLDLGAVRRGLASGLLPPAAASPPWRKTLQQIEQAGPFAGPVDSNRLPGAYPFPFEDVFAAHLDVARRRLERELAAIGAADAVSTTAWRDLERGLAGRLASLASEALITAFDDFRGGRPSGIAVRLAEAGIRRETRQFGSFVTEARRGLLGERWPVLARLTATAVDQWVASSAEMIRRLREDQAEIGTVFFSGGPLASATLALSAPDLSDPHHGGRTVHILTLPEGRLVYKPRSLGPEEDFARLLAWCGERGLSLDLRLPRTLDRGGHGWMEVATPSACPDMAAARRFHRRAGMLLGLLHAFGSRDCHSENLIACGEHPIPVDLEAWLPVRLHRWPPGAERGEAWREAARRIERSVLATGLLPQWQDTGRGELRSVGALGGGRPGRRLQRVWRAVNCDAMVRSWQEVEVPVQPNVPVLAGEPLNPSEFLPELAAGFTEMYRLLLRHRDELLSPHGPLDRIPGRKTRLILRSTGAYRKLLERSLRPDCCRDGAARSVELEFLARPYLEAENRPEVWPLLAAERQALEQGDVPRFLVPMDDPVVEIPGGEVKGALKLSSLAAMRENLAGLDEGDLRLQLGFLRAALGSLSRQEPGRVGREATVGDGDPLLAAARAIAGRLVDLAVLGSDGSTAWIGPRYLGATDHYELAVLDSDLYGGTAGVALFLAALAQATGDARSRDLALRAVASVRRSLMQRVRPALGIGGVTGLASLCYAFAWIGELLGEEAPIREALALSVHLEPRRIGADRDLDVVSGSAGAILALLALHRAAPGPNPAGRTALEIAGECADHLLARRPATPDGPRGWPPRRGAPLAGFAHGASGIGCALLRLYERTGRRELWEAACEGLAFERRLLAAQNNGGREPRRQNSHAATWCRGAPGIALARLATLDVLDGGDVRREIAAGLEAARSQPQSAVDSLCCGNFGRVEVLVEASRILGDPALLAAAREIAACALARSLSSGRFRCLPHGNGDLIDPSCFRGEAGIGFALLRLAGREDLPCLLRLASGPSENVQKDRNSVVDSGLHTREGHS